MSEKEEALQQISEIKSHLIDKQSFFPYNYNACYIMGRVSLDRKSTIRKNHS